MKDDEKKEIKSYNIESIIKQVESIATPDPPSITTFTSMEGYFESMTEALAIIGNYSSLDQDYPPEIIEKDMIVLSALHAQMAVMVGYLQGTSARAESARKMAVAKYVMAINKHKGELLKAGHLAKTTGDEVRFGAKLLAEDEATMARDHETISRIITNCWYAINNHIQVLRSSLKRATEAPLI